MTSKMDAFTDNERELRIRRRATALVMRNGRLLLLREPADTEFSLPGGGIDDGEPPSLAVARELHEETGLTASKVEYLFDHCDFWGLSGADYWGQVHHVFRVDAIGEVALSPEHCEFTWWDRTAELPLWAYVKPMLTMLSRSE